MYFYIIYTSNATGPMSDQALSSLLAECRKINKLKRITGMLLYFRKSYANQIGGKFIQVLEGKEKDVRYVFDKIKADERHTYLEVICELPIVQRSFKSWTMGFEILDEINIRELPGSFNLNPDFSTNQPGAFNASLDLLRFFYTANRNSRTDDPAIYSASA